MRYANISSIGCIDFSCILALDYCFHVTNRNPTQTVLGTPAEATGRVTERVGKSWLNMASGMVRQRSLPRACADLCVLIRNLRFVQLELLKKFNLRSDVVILIPLVDHAEPLGLRNPQLSF